MFFFPRAALATASALPLLLIAASEAQAQSVGSTLTSYGQFTQASALGNDFGPNSSSETDVVTSGLLVENAGQLSEPFGSGSTFAYQNAFASGEAVSDITGPLPPSLGAGANASGTQSGVIPASTQASGSGGANFDWSFAFYAPTFAAQPFPVPIVFNFQALATASASPPDASGFAGSAQSRLDLVGFDVVGPVAFAASAGTPTVTTDLLDVDIVTAAGIIWDVVVTATAGAGGAAPLVGLSGSAAASSAVSGIQLMVDFSATRAEILATTTLSTTDTDQGLAELFVVLPPEISLEGFAPQFVPEPSVAASLVSGIGLLGGLARRRRAGCRPRRPDVDR